MGPQVEAIELERPTQTELLGRVAGRRGCAKRAPGICRGSPTGLQLRTEQHMYVSREGTTHQEQQQSRSSHGAKDSSLSQLPGRGNLAAHTVCRDSGRCCLSHEAKLTLDLKLIWSRPTELEGKPQRDELVSKKLNCVLGQSSFFK